MEVFTQFASDLDDMTKAQLAHGKALMELLKQPLCHPLSLHEQVMTLCMANNGIFDSVPTKEVKKYQGDILEFLDLKHPEHLEIAFSDAEAWAQKIVNAGAIFMGPYTTEPLGDYFAGPNHTLPTMGTAAFSSPLGVYDFVKRSSLLEYDKDAFGAVADKVMRFANVEGLQAHGLAVRRRIDE